MQLTEIRHTGYPRKRVEVFKFKTKKDDLLILTSS